jgi:hypothetical protein
LHPQTVCPVSRSLEISFGSKFLNSSSSRNAFVMKQMPSVNFWTPTLWSMNVLFAESVICGGTARQSLAVLDCIRTWGHRKVSNQEGRRPRVQGHCIWERTQTTRVPGRLGGLSCGRTKTYKSAQCHSHNVPRAHPLTRCLHHLSFPVLCFAKPLHLIRHARPPCIPLDNKQQGIRVQQGGCYWGCCWGGVKMKETDSDESVGAFRQNGMRTDGGGGRWPKNSATAHQGKFCLSRKGS